jgi:aspartate racemase
LRTVGLIGGVSWHATLEYYRVINSVVARVRGGTTSAKLVLLSLNFEEVLRAGRDDSTGEHVRIYTAAARALQRAGADFIVICSNTGHRRADEIEQAAGLEVLHIADVTANAVRAAGYSRVALLGTAATMEGPFIKERLENRWHVEVVVPDEANRRALDHLIVDELSHGVFSEEARALTLRVMDRLHREQGAEASILGCTELPLLLNGSHGRYPVFDTLRLHAEAAAERSLAG